MAKVILKCRYLRPGASGHSKNLVKYIGTRDGVERIDDSWKQKDVTAGQKKLVAEMLRDFPDAANSHEYHDYQQTPTRGNASEFISRTIEDHIDLIGKKENYVQYIAKRPRVERDGTHGLFSQVGGPIDLEKVAKEVAQHPGVVWTDVLSMRREDATRLDFGTGRSWRTLIRNHAQDMAKAMRIPLEDLRWYAAFHNEGHHPHCHIVAYSVGKEPYMSTKSMVELKGAFARDIFRQDRIQIFEQQTKIRDNLKLETEKLMAQITDQIHSGIFRNQNIEVLIQSLANRLASTSGKKVYGYLNQPARNIVNGIIDELEKEPGITRLYDLWYEQQCRVVSLYQDKDPEKLPLSENKTFHSLRNTVIREVLRLEEYPTAAVLTESPLAEDPDPEPEPVAPAFPECIPPKYPLPATTDEALPPPVEPEEEAPAPVFSAFRPKDKNSWWTEEYKQARSFLYGIKESQPDFDRAFLLLEAEAKKGNGLAMHDLGKMYLSSLGCEADEALAQRWFADAFTAFSAKEQTDKKKDYWQYRIGKLYAYGYGVEQDDTQAAAWFRKAVDAENPFAAYSLGSQYYRVQGVEKDLEQAFSLFQMAAEHESKPNAYAQYQLGAMYKDGIGTSADKELSDHWYAESYQGFLAIEAQMADDKLYYRLGAMNLQGIGTEKNLELAKDYFVKAAALGNADAQYGLGKLYLDKEFAGYEPAKAVIFLKDAAAKDHSYAQYTLGKLMLQGELVDKNIPEAVELLEAAAAQDNLYAHYTLGKVYTDESLGVVDVSVAIPHLEAAAKQGFSLTQYRLAKVYISLGRTAEAIPWLEEAIRDGNQYAQYQLGKMLLFGQSIDKDVERGMALLQASATQGNAYAQTILDNYGKPPVTFVGLRLLASVSRLLQGRIQEDHKQAPQVDKKLRQKIAEKKQAQGLKMG